MARHNGLRPIESERPATTGRFAFLQSLSPIRTAAILTILAAAFVVVYHLAGVGGGSKATQPAFLTRALSAPQRSASFVGKPAPSLHVTIGKRGGYTVARPGGSVRVAPQFDGWSS